MDTEIGSLHTTSRCKKIIKYKQYVVCMKEFSFLGSKMRFFCVFLSKSVQSWHDNY